MKFAKKLVSLILTAAVLLSMAASFFASAADGELPPAEAELLAENKKMQKAIDVLSALGVIALYSDGSFKINENATRADMIVNTLRLMNITDGTIASEELFSDVTKDYWAYDEINAAYSMKLINGYSDGLFRPDAAITLNEAVKLLVTLLGYSSIAEAKGGYPGGYLAIAHEKDITGGISTKNSDLPINRGTMAMLIYNSISVGLMEAVTYGENMRLEADPDNTIISKYRNIYKSEGLVTANTLTELNSSNRDSNTVIITTLGNEEEYFPGKTDVNSFLGYYIEFYYEMENNTAVKKLLYISAKENKNEVLDIKVDQISEYTTNLSFKYYRDAENEGDLKTVSIYEGANVIYNGIYAGYKAHALDNSLLRPKSGGVTLFDIDKDGKYDIVSIKDSRTVLVDSVSLNDSKIYDKYLGKPIELDENEYIIKKGGKTIQINELKGGDILSVVQSDKFKEITVVDTEPLVGSVAAVYDGKLVIAGKEYKISESYNISGEYFSFDPSAIELGDEGTFYFDIDGRIAAFSEYSSSLKYGFIVKAGFDGRLSKVLQIRTLEEDGKFITHTLADKVEIDGAKKKDAEEINSYLHNTGMSGTGADGEGVYQMIAYKENPEGKISFIDTTTVGKDEILEETLTLDIDDRLADKKYKKYNSIYYTTPKIFVPRFNTEMPNLRENGASTSFTVTDNTPVFIIPVDENINLDLDNEDEEAYSVIRASGLSTSEYSVSAYSVDKTNNNEARVVMIKTISGGDVDPEVAAAAVVVKKKKALDSSGNYVTQLTLYQAGRLTEVQCKDNAIVKIFDNGSLSEAQSSVRMTTDYIQKGHAIMYSMSSSGLIANIDVMFPTENIDPSQTDFGDIDFSKEEGWAWGISDTYCKAFGQVLRKSGTKIKVKLENVCDAIGRAFMFKTIYNFYDLSSANIIIVDVNKKTVVQGTINDIIGEEQGDGSCYALCTMRSNVVDTAVIYKF